MKQHYLDALARSDLFWRTGEVSQFSGLIIESIGPASAMGAVCEIYSRENKTQVTAEVVGFKQNRVLLMPYGDLSGIELGCKVVATNRTPQIPVGKALLGRVIDAFGHQLDQGPALAIDQRRALYAKPINPLTRPRINKILETGVCAVDTLLTLGRGQRVGIFSGSGVGKSTLLGMLARHVKADINVIALIGERGREVREFIEKNLGPEGLAKSVVVVATSDQPAIVRVQAAYAALTIAEFFRDSGSNVLLTMDSATRFAMAKREIGLSAGEPPTARGYTPSVFTALPKLLERCGNSNTGGSITGLFTVLVEGDDMNDPISDAMRSILDGHIVLSRQLASHGHYPAIDPLHSVSRLLTDLADKKELKIVRDTVALLSTYEKNRQMIEIGAYRPGSNIELDRVIKLVPEINKILCQDTEHHTPRAEAFRMLQTLLSSHGIK